METKKRMANEKIKEIQDKKTCWITRLLADGRGQLSKKMECQKKFSV